jgi:ABC-type enterochelin transport system permease subunit
VPARVDAGYSSLGCCRYHRDDRYIDTRMITHRRIVAAVLLVACVTISEMATALVGSIVMFRGLFFPPVNVSQSATKYRPPY